MTPGTHRCTIQNAAFDGSFRLHVLLCIDGNQIYLFTETVAVLNRNWGQLSNAKTRADRLTLDTNSARQVRLTSVHLANNRVVSIILVDKHQLRPSRTVLTKLVCIASGWQTAVASKSEGAIAIATARWTASMCSE